MEHRRKKRSRSDLHLADIQCYLSTMHVCLISALQHVPQLSRLGGTVICIVYSYAPLSDTTSTVISFRKMFHIFFICIIIIIICWSAFWLPSAKSCRKTSSFISIISGFARRTLIRIPKHTQHENLVGRARILGTATATLHTLTCIQQAAPRLVHYFLVKARTHTHTHTRHIN